MLRFLNTLPAFARLPHLTGLGIVCGGTRSGKTVLLASQFVLPEPPREGPTWVVFRDPTYLRLAGALGAPAVAAPPVRGPHAALPMRGRVFIRFGAPEDAASTGRQSETLLSLAEFLFTLADRVDREGLTSPTVVLDEIPSLAAGGALDTVLLALHCLRGAMDAHGGRLLVATQDVAAFATTATDLWKTSAFRILYPAGRSWEAATREHREALQLPAELLAAPARPGCIVLGIGARWSPRRVRVPEHLLRILQPHRPAAAVPAATGRRGA